MMEKRSNPRTVSRRTREKKENLLGKNPIRVEYLRSQMKKMKNVGVISSITGS